MLISLDSTTLVANTTERLIGSDGSPYEKRMDARGRVLSDKCIADGIPFEELPEGWAWARLSMLTANVHYGYTCKSSSNGHIKLLRITDIQNGHVDWNSVPYCAVDPKDYSTYLLKEGDILIARTGGTIGKSYFIRDKPPVSAFASYLIRAIPIKNEIVPYFKCYFESPAYWGQLIDASAGTGQPNVNAASIGRILIAIPPLAEQRRIVERVNELMPLVEEYGGLEDAREALDAALPGRLRKSVLQLAVRGGLVPQDPADEPAGALLERIRGQRRQLVADGKAKAPKGGESIIFAGSDGRRYEKRVDAKGRESVPACIEDEIPFEIPEGWEWARLGSVFTKMGSGSTPAGGRKVYQDKGPMLIRSQNVHNEGLRLDDVAHFAYSLFAKRGSHVLPNDMLLNITGASIGRCAIVPDTFGDADVNQHVLIMRPVLPIASEYLHAAIISPLVQSAIMVGQVGATKEGLSASKAAELLVPFPPLVEQHRIVDVVDRLFKLLA